ncbi:small ribosomal subunit protein mS39 [Mantella aurantiaca]
MALPCVRLGSVRLLSRDLYRFLCRNTSHQAAAAAEEINIPKKKTWDKTAVLQALAYTVTHDPTTVGYKFHDDPYLSPKSSADYQLYSTTKESGKNAAKYILDMYPNLFEKDIAEPHIPCLMPQSVQPQIEEISEEALRERIQFRRVQDSVNLYDQLLQAGTPPSVETTNRLLDLLCFYGDKEPSLESQENPEKSGNAKNPGFKGAPQVSWRDNNNAERIFNLMPEKDEHSFRAMIRGMVKHGASSKAFSMYTDLLNNRLTGDVHTFNALIIATPKINSERKKRWALIADLLNQMVQQKVQPNLYTFNALLNAMKNTGAKDLALQMIMEMKALRIGNMLPQAEILEDILQAIDGKSFTAQDPDDVKFFLEAIRVCLETKDLDLAYKVDALKNTGDNWKLLGNRGLQALYYGRLFSIICLLESVDVALKWYRAHIPSRFYPNTMGIVNFLQIIEMENRLELIPEIWKDVRLIGHLNKDNLIQEFLQVMARGKQNPELQVEFANIAAFVKSRYEAPSQLKWSSALLGNIAILLCRAGRMEEVWKTLKIFRTQNLVPRPHVMEELLDCTRTLGNASVAIDLVQLAVGYHLPNTAKLAQTVLEDFTLSEEQRITLQDVAQHSSTSSSSSSSSDSDQE